MALPPSGAISFNNINVELGVTGTTQASLGQTSYRTLAGVPSGAISMSNFYGKANQFNFTIASNQTNANLATLATAAGWNGTSKVVATINSGIYVSSNATGTPGLTVNGSFPGGVALINNGFIIGMGGAGGQGRLGTGFGGSSGGGALSVSTPISITNMGPIGGGGGGGGGGGQGWVFAGYSFLSYSGSGGGGGRTGTTNSAAGGRQHPSGGLGNSGTSASAGAQFNQPPGGFGGAGGNWGAVGSGGGTGSSASTGGDSPATNYGSGGGGGGGAGYAVSGNSNITWVATGTRLGSIS